MRVTDFAIVALLALTACNGNGDAEADPGPAPVVLGVENITVAETAELTSGPLISGTLSPELAASVRAEIGGSVTEVMADAGQTVRKGFVLARIDDTSLRDAWIGARAALRSAESNFQVQQRNAERTARLEQAGAVAERDLEAARSTETNAEGQVADARARLTSAERQLAKATVRAPFSGIVADATVSTGDVVASGTALFTVVDPSTMRLEATVPAEELGSLSLDMPVAFKVSGYDREFAGNIRSINPVVDPATRQVRILVSLPNAERTLVAGLFAEGRVASETRRGVVVPRGAVDVRGIRPVAMRLRGGRVEKLELVLGLEDRATERYEITKGVSAGDTLLLGSAQGITPGTVARVRSRVE
jgi:membrane fusion protein (multidrug efflux system)